jgi:hypothetical protein
MVVTSKDSERKYRICLWASPEELGFIGRLFFKLVVKDHPEEQSNALDFVGGIVRKISFKSLVLISLARYRPEGEKGDLHSIACS